MSGSRCISSIRSGMLNKSAKMLNKSAGEAKMDDKSEDYTITDKIRLAATKGMTRQQVVEMLGRELTPKEDGIFKQAVAFVAGWNL